MKKTVLILAAVLFAVFMLMAGNSQADVIHGTIWAPTTDLYNFGTHDLTNAFFSGAAIGPVKSTFTVTGSINFDSGLLSTESYNSWLSGGGAVFYANSPSSTFAAGPIQTTGTTASFFQFTGTTNFASAITIRHDDGIQLYIDNVLLIPSDASDPSTPTSPELTPYTITPGSHSFTLNYAAWNGFPEVLQVNNNPVPIPAAVWLLGSGLIGLAGIRRRFKK